MISIFIIELSIVKMRIFVTIMRVSLLINNYEPADIF